MYLEGPRFFFLTAAQLGAETLFHDWLGANRQKTLQNLYEFVRFFWWIWAVKSPKKTHTVFRGANFPGVFSPEVGLEIEVQWIWHPKKTDQNPFKLEKKICATSEWDQCASNNWIPRVAWLLELYIPHTIHVWYISLHLVDFYGECR